MAHRQLTTSAPARKAASGVARAAGGPRSNGAVLADLRQLEQLLSDYDWYERRMSTCARKLARDRALEALASGLSTTEARRAALFVAATELVISIRAELAAAPDDAAHLAEQLESVIGISRLALGRAVLRAPELISSPPREAIEHQLTMLLAFAPLRSVSLWKVGDGENAECMCHVGEGEPSRRARTLAGRMLMAEDEEADETRPRTLLLALAIGSPRDPAAVLVATAKPWMRERCRPFLLDAVPLLAAIVERDILLSGNEESERALVEASERKLTRLGFDLHDGPIQDVAMLAEDLRLFRDQLEQLVDPTNKKLVGGRVEDLEAQTVALDTELRRLAGEVQAASVLLNRPFARALRDRVDAFSARTGIQPKLALAGDMSLISASQQIALLNIVHEGLNNIREHSGATAVEIAVTAHKDTINAQIMDNGSGFDLESALLRAGREGRVGLVAINERIRLLGGRCRIDSKRGGPTVISVTLKRWRPAPDAD
jgi:signal transduction histidine kinase